MPSLPRPPTNITNRHLSTQQKHWSSVSHYKMKNIMTVLALVLSAAFAHAQNTAIKKENGIGIIR